MSRQTRLPENEWFYPVLVDDITTQGRSYEISPSEAQKKAIAKRLGLISLDRLSARLAVGWDSGHVVHITGELEAEVTQSCVVTLEPISSNVTDSFEAWFADHSQAVSFKRAQHEALLKKEMVELPVLEESEDPEPIEDGKIDLGELVIQYLSLAVPAYPHKEGVSYENKEALRAEPARETLRPNPFAALKNWRPKD